MQTVSKNHTVQARGTGCSTRSGLRLWDEIKNLSLRTFSTDEWKKDAKFMPPEQHVQMKVETYTVEGYNSRIRHDLARFKRKTKYHSKSQMK